MCVLYSFYFFVHTDVQFSYTRVTFEKKNKKPIKQQASNWTKVEVGTQVYHEKKKKIHTCVYIQSSGSDVGGGHNDVTQDYDDRCFGHP